MFFLISWFLSLIYDLSMNNYLEVLKITLSFNNKIKKKKIKYKTIKRYRYKCYLRYLKTNENTKNNNHFSNYDNK